TTTHRPAADVNEPRSTRRNDRGSLCAQRSLSLLANTRHLPQVSADTARLFGIVAHGSTMSNLSEGDRPAKSLNGTVSVIDCAEPSTSLNTARGTWHGWETGRHAAKSPPLCAQRQEG